MLSKTTTGPLKSDLKLLEYVNWFVKEPICIKVNDISMDIPSVPHITIKPSFWLTDSCLMCGKCCGNKGVAYFESEIDNLKSTNIDLFNKLQKSTFEINGKSHCIYYRKPIPQNKCVVNNTYDQRTVYCCEFIDKQGEHYKCSIHQVRSFTCKFPHIRMYKNKYGTCMSTRQFGRNWALKCEAQFYSPSKHSVESKLNLFKQFYEAIKYLGVTTWLPEIIQYVETVLVEWDKKGAPTQDIVLSNKTKPIFGIIQKY